jgi:hypothetical protein
MKAVLLLLALILNAAPALAGRETGNGGDPVAIEFLNRAFEAAMNIRNSPDAFGELKNIDVLGILGKTEIMVVDQELTVNKDGTTQRSAAVNFRNPRRILINRAAWNGIGSDRLKQSLALHETLSLAGFEETGVYKVVSRYEEIPNRPIYLPAARDYWAFHSPSELEQKQFARFLPAIPDFGPPTSVKGASQKLHFMIRIEDALTEATVQVLRYELMNRNEMESKDFYQLVVTGANGQAISQDIILNDPSFRVGIDLFQRLEILQLTADHGQPGYRYRSLDGKISYFLGFTDLQENDVRDIVPLPLDGEVLILGKLPDGPYGLYRARVQNRPTLVKAFKQVIPGFAAAGPAPLPMVKAVLGVFKNERGIYAVVNDLEGIVVVNIDTGESKAVYEVPEPDHFAAVVRSIPPTAEGNCEDIVLGIYPDKLGGIFYRTKLHTNGDGLTLAGSTGEDPLYLLHLGVQATSQFFKVRATGCP